jgi:hypothetical protein
MPWDCRGHRRPAFATTLSPSASRRAGAVESRGLRPLLVGALLVAGCGTSRPWALTPRPAEGLPEQFVPVGAPAGAARCMVHLKDPRDDTRLDLIRSAAVTDGAGSPSQLGDYAVLSAGRYGVGPNELLRVDCDSGRAIGVVDRGS